MLGMQRNELGDGGLAGSFGSCQWCAPSLPTPVNIWESTCMHTQIKCELTETGSQRSECRWWEER